MSKVSEEITLLIRQYKRTCDDELIEAFHLGETLDYINSLHSEMESLSEQLDDIHSKDRSMLSYHAKYRPEEYMRHVTGDMLFKYN